jgi:hypothetical protein
MVTLLVDESEAARSRSNIGILDESRAHSVIEAREHEVIAVQDVDEVAAAALDAGIEGCGRACVLGFTIEGDTAAAKLVYDGFRVIFGGAVVDDLDLHLVGARVLAEHAL